jgi:hypothetical protein
MSGIMLNQVGGSFAPEVPTVIGQAFGGGFYAGQIGVSSVATHYLIVGPYSSAVGFGKEYRLSTLGGDPLSLIDGPANSAAMNNADHPAAQFCEGLSIGGFTDWYLPAINEIEVCYYNLKPNTSSNNTSTGVNANAVPARASNYTAGIPAQTSATIFQTGGAEAFFASTHWSSSENSSDSTKAWYKSFSAGGQTPTTKTTSMVVRAIRRIPV